MTDKPRRRTLDQVKYSSALHIQQRKRRMGVLWNVPHLKLVTDDPYWFPPALDYDGVRENELRVKCSRYFLPAERSSS